jgi:heme a synthase
MDQASNKKKDRLFWLSVSTTIAIFIVNTAGFIDTMTGSAQGCGKSWPLCHGSIAPWNWDIHAWIEFGHRFLVFTASVLLITLSVIAWRKYGENRKVKVMICLAILGVILESILGAMAVFFVNPPAVLALHMGIALMSFGSLVALSFIIRQMNHPHLIPRVSAGQTISRLTWFTFFYLYLAIYFGAYVASSGAGVAFQGYLIPTESYAAAGNFLYIDAAHRAIALGLLILVIAITVLSNRIKSERRDLYYGGMTASVLVVIQALVGMLLIYTHLGLVSIMFHVSIASLIFGAMCFLSIQCMYKPSDETLQKKEDVSDKEEYAFRKRAPIK